MSLENLAGKDLGSQESVASLLKQHVDDIDGVTIPIQPRVEILDPATGRAVPTDRPVVFLRLCNGQQVIIDHEVAEVLINDGIFQRLGIKCSLRTEG